MKVLLDTHVWLWGLLEPQRLTRKSRNLLTAENTELWLSSISIWETLVLTDRGRLTLANDPELWIAEALERVPCNELPVNNTIALKSRTIDLPHQDPADRFIAATAAVFDLTLITADKKLLSCPDIATIPA